MKSHFYPLTVFMLVSFLLLGCSSTLASAVPPTVTSTPTEKPKPTLTPTRTPQAIVESATEISAPPTVPSPFEIAMLFTNGSCGTGTPTWTYTFTIDGTSLTQVQTDGIGGPDLITLTGSYDPASGAFSASADVGTGIETYAGVIGFDGTTITVTGVYGYTPTGGTACTFDFDGTATP